MHFESVLLNVDLIEIYKALYKASYNKNDPWLCSSLEPKLASIVASHRSIWLFKDTLNNEVFKNNYVGFMVIDYQNFELEIMDIGINPNYQYKGIATLMLQWLFKKYDWQTVFLEVNRHNLNAIKLYEKFGFKLQRVRANYYGTNQDALCLALTK